jgi:hypothetical protein
MSRSFIERGVSNQFVNLTPRWVLWGSSRNVFRSILVVEDDPINRAILSRKLRSQGFEIIEAKNGLEALDAFSFEFPNTLRRRVSVHERHLLVHKNAIGSPVLEGI